VTCMWIMFLEVVGRDLSCVERQVVWSGAAVITTHCALASLAPPPPPPGLHHRGSPLSPSPPPPSRELSVAEVVWRLFVEPAASSADGGGGGRGNAEDVCVLIRTTLYPDLAARLPDLWSLLVQELEDAAAAADTGVTDDDAVAASVISAAQHGGGGGGGATQRPGQIRMASDSPQAAEFAQVRILGCPIRTNPFPPHSRPNLYCTSRVAYLNA
jgi:hypothetical protein